MAKTYEIWRKTNLSADRYDFSNYVKVLTVEPLGDISLNTTRYEDKEFYRTNLVDELTFGASDFYSLLCIKLDPIVNDMTYLFVIKDGATVYWKGFIALVNGNWDENNCIVKLPSVVFDVYSIFIDTYDIERNVLQNVTPKRTFTILNSAWFEFLYDTGTVAPTPSNGYDLAFSKSGSPNEYIFIRHRCSTKADTFIAYDESGVIVYAKSPIPPATLIGSFIVDSVTQPPDVGGVNYVNIASTFWILRTDPAPSGGKGYEDLYIYEGQSYSNSLWLNDIIDEFISDAGYISFESSFLKYATNPITGSANKLLNLFISQASDVINPTATEKATSLQLTMGNIDNILRVINAR